MNKDRICKKCGTQAFCYDNRPPSWMFIIVKDQKCIKCFPDHFIIKGKKGEGVQLSIL